MNCLTFRYIHMETKKEKQISTKEIIINAQKNRITEIQSDGTKHGFWGKIGKKKISEVIKKIS